MMKKEIIQNGIQIGALRADQESVWMRQKKERILDAIERWHQINKK